MNPLAPIPTPEGYRPHRPAGTPEWPAMFIREDEQAVLVIGKHATLKRLAWGQVIVAAGPLTAGFVLSTLTAPVIGSEAASGFLMLAFLVSMVVWLMIDKLGRYVAWRFIGQETVVRFDRQQIVIDGQVWKRLPQVDVRFRQHPLPDLPERMLNKRQDQRALLNMTRNLDMIYGDQVRTIATIPDPVRAEMFTAVLTRAAAFFDKPFDRPTASAPDSRASASTIDPRDIPQ